MQVFVVFHLHQEGDFEVQGVFSTSERAAAICAPGDAVVSFELDKDYTDISEFDVQMPVPADDR